MSILHHSHSMHKDVDRQELGAFQYDVTKRDEDIVTGHREGVDIRGMRTLHLVNSLVDLIKDITISNYTPCFFLFEN